MNCESKSVATNEAADLSVTTAVVAAISELSGCDPVDLDVRLADHVDPDALEALFAGGGRAETELAITVGSYEVSVRAAGDEVTVTARDGVRHSRRVVHR